jgi:hypothetical protein
MIFFKKSNCSCGFLAVGLLRCKLNNPTVDVAKHYKLGAGPTAALNDWLQIRGKQPGSLFNPINKGGNICKDNRSSSSSSRGNSGGQQLAPITDQAVLNILSKCGTLNLGASWA